MYKMILVSLSLLLVVSIAGVIFLLTQNNAKFHELELLNDELKQTKASLGKSEDSLSKTKNDLEQIQADFSKAQTDLSTKDEKIRQLQSDKSKLQSENTKLTRTVKRVMCQTTIDSAELKSISTNQGLVDLITTTMEDDYNMTSVNTSFDTLWNNSKSSIFTVMGVQNNQKYAYKSVVSWDLDRSVVLGIYDIGQACYYYLP